MVESYFVTSSWCQAAQECFMLAWLMAIWISSSITPGITLTNRSIGRVLSIVVSLFVILSAWWQMQSLVSDSKLLEMMQQARAQSHLPPIASSQLMKLGFETYWSSWLVISLAVICSALQFTDSILRTRYPRTLGLIYSGLFITFLCGAGLIGGALWRDQHLSESFRSTQITYIGLTALFGIIVAVYFIIIHRQRKVAQSSPNSAGCDQDQAVQEQP